MGLSLAVFFSLVRVFRHKLPGILGAENKFFFFPLLHHIQEMSWKQAGNFLQF
jgi:hypothetical protein